MVGGIENHCEINILTRNSDDPRVYQAVDYL